MAGEGGEEGLQGPAGAAGAHPRADGPKTGPASRIAESETSKQTAHERRLAFARKPVAVRLHQIRYSDGRIAWEQEADFDMARKPRADGRKEIITKRKVVCVYKAGKVLSGKWPKDQAMPDELKATIARMQRPIGA